MQLGIFAKTFAGSDPLTVLRAARDAGFETVQYNMSGSGIASLPDVIPAAAARDLLHAIKVTGVGVAAISATYNMIHPRVETVQSGRQALMAISEFARDVGVKLLTVCTGSRDATNQWKHHPDNQTPEAWFDLTAEFTKILEIAERQNIDIGVEPEHANVVNTAERAAALISELKSERVKIVLDPANLVEHAAPSAWNGVVENSVELLHKRIALVHAKDRTVDGNVVPAGQGGVDFSLFLKTLRRNGFAGPVVTHGLEARDAPQVAGYLRGLLTT